MRHRTAVWLAPLVLAVSALLPGYAHAKQATPSTGSSDWPALPSAVKDLASHIAHLADNGGLPFAVVDKQAAMLMVYRRNGGLAGVTTVLLGLTPGDRSSPGVGARAQDGRLTIADRTTPAGRFESEPGHNLSGEHVVWIDYGEALAIHRLRPAPTGEERIKRMASARPRDKRISAGCVVVPESFYEGVVRPVLGTGPAVVYVMPENSDWTQLWKNLAMTAR